MNSEPADHEGGSERLHRDTVKVSMILLAGVALLAGVPTAIGFASWQSFGFAMAWVLPGAAVLVGGGTFADYLRWRKTRYRVLEDTVEIRKGIVFVSRRQLGRERIRAVDLSAHVVLRMFGLVPQAAFVRRLRWALLPTAAAMLGCVALLAVVSLPGWGIAVAVGVLVVLGVALVVRAWDSARNLGHALSGAYLLARRGSIRRSTVLLRRGGIIGWRVRQSVFQHRASLATLTAITAAGRGHYPVVDGDVDEIRDTANAAVPDLLGQFLIHDHVETAGE